MAVFNHTAAAGNALSGVLNTTGSTSPTLIAIGVRPVPHPTEVRNPANATDPWGSFHRIETFDDTDAGAARIRYHRADTNLPPFVTEVLATPGPTDDYGRVFIQPGLERTFIIYEDGSNAVEVYSDSDGDDWSAPALAISGGTRPAAAVGSDGTIYRCAYVAGYIQFTRQEVGEPTPVLLGSVAVDETETPIQVEEDTIGLAEAFEAHAGLLMSIIVLGDTVVSDWVSYDDAVSFERLP